MAENHSNVQGVLWERLPEKFCPRCKKVLPLTDFYRLNKSKRLPTKVKDRKTGKYKDKRTHTSWCKFCRKIKTDWKRKIEREQGKTIEVSRRLYGRVRERRLETIYGLTVEQYDEMVIAQKGLCAICGLPEKVIHHKGTPRRLCVDHDHKPGGKTRGLLCRDCNVGLGSFQDDKERLKKAIAYLESYEK